VVLVTLTRANDEGDVGFTKDHRRVNVSLTRAKRLLVVFCSVSTLLHAPATSGREEWRYAMSRSPARPLSSHAAPSLQSGALADSMDWAIAASRGGGGGGVGAGSAAPSCVASSSCRASADNLSLLCAATGCGRWSRMRSAVGLCSPWGRPWRRWGAWR
jgi:hypothetical protein